MKLSREAFYKILSPELRLVLAGIWLLGKRLLRWKNSAATPLQLAVLEQCKKEYLTPSNRHSSEEVPASVLWQKYLGFIKQKILTFKNPKRAIHYAQTQIGFEHRTKVALILNDIPLYERQLLMEFPQFSGLILHASDSPFSDPASMISYNGRLVSNVFYYHLRYVLQCLSNVSEPKNICEIGGGTGAPARLWFTNSSFQPDTYTIIDYPECLFFANLFLRLNIPHVSVIYVEENTILKEVKQNTIILCPIQFIKKLNSLKFDLVINTGSLQEMTEEAVTFWMNWVDTIHCRFFYSLNYFSQPLKQLAEGSSLWSTRLSNRWIHKVNRANPHFTKLQSIRNFGEILAEKLDSPIVLSESAVEERYNYLISRSFDEQTFMDLIDLARLSKDENLIQRILDKCLEKMNYIPKECFYLSSMLKKTNPDNNQINTLHSKLKEIYAKSLVYH